MVHFKSTYVSTKILFITHNHILSVFFFFNMTRNDIINESISLLVAKEKNQRYLLKLMSIKTY